MENVTVIIPANYTEAGKILGIFELRNLIEAAIFTVPLLLFCLFLLPFSLTANLIITAIFCVPIGGFSLIGIHGYSLLTFLKIYYQWRKYRQEIHGKPKRKLFRILNSKKRLVI